MMRKTIPLFSLLICFIFTGCSHVLYERQRSENASGDVGSETSFNVRGPKASINHKF